MGAGASGACKDAAGGMTYGGCTGASGAKVVR